MRAEFLLLGLLIVKRGLSAEKCKPKIAIIGAGIGGASASHFLTELFNENLEIDIFEADKVGGRLATVNIEENVYEAGGSIIHSRNRYMHDFVKLLGMEKRPTGKNQRFGVWNGEEFVIEESDWEIVTLAKLFYRYGFQPFRLNRYVNSILDDFDQIYKLQDDGVAFKNLSELLSAMNSDFTKLLEVSMKDHLISLGFSTQLIDELVEATLVVNYGQETNVQSFVGCVSVAGAGADLWSVKGGNKEVPAHLIYRNKKVNMVPSEVRKVRYISPIGSSPRYEVSYSNKGSDNIMQNMYDIVIMATPLTGDQKIPIAFLGFPENETLQFSGLYQKTVATFVEGDINPHYFGLQEPLDGILSCNPNRTKISSVGRLISVEGPTGNISRVWKIFSSYTLKPHEIQDMFSKVDRVQSIEWKAYPKYSTKERSDRFKLYDSLYHVNAIEWAASAMEMSAIGGRNVAILAHKEFTINCRNQDTDKSTRVPDTPLSTSPSSEL